MAVVEGFDNLQSLGIAVKKETNFQVPVSFA